MLPVYILQHHFIVPRLRPALISLWHSLSAPSVWKGTNLTFWRRSHLVSQEGSPVDVKDNIQWMEKAILENVYIYIFQNSRIYI